MRMDWPPGTKASRSSMALRLWGVRSRSVQARYRRWGSSSARPGSALSSSSMSSMAPIWPSSSMRSIGSWPACSRSGAKRSSSWKRLPTAPGSSEAGAVVWRGGGSLSVSRGSPQSCSADRACSCPATSAPAGSPGSCSISRRTTSTDASRALTSSPLTETRPLRTPSSTVSIAWVKPARVVRPTMPALPLMVWAARKMRLTISRSFGSSSSWIRACSRSRTVSTASWAKRSRSSSWAMLEIVPWLRSRERCVR